jgi:hypothetical protein
LGLTTASTWDDGRYPLPARGRETLAIFGVT